MARPEPFLPRQAHARPLATFASAFLLGLIAGKARPAPILACAGALGGAALLCALLRKNRRAFAVCLLLAGFAAGLCRMTLALDAIPTVETQYSVAMTGRVVSEPFQNPDTGRLISQFQLETLNGEASDLRLRLYLRDEANTLRKSHESPVMKLLYDEYFEAPGKEKAHHLLHTTYVKRGK